MLHPKKVSKRTKSIHVAYVGGIDENRKVCDTRTQDQNEMLLSVLTLLISKYPKARIFSAHEILGASNDPGFKVRDWLKSYIPKCILTAA